MSFIKSIIAHRAFQSCEFWLTILTIIVCGACAAAKVPDSLGADGWLVIGTITVLFIALARDSVPADFTMLAAVTVLVLFQVISTSEALEGFASSAVASVAVLYPVAAGLTATGGLDYLMSRILGSPKTLTDARLRLMIPVSILSAFMNNTPLVAIMIPIVQQWSLKMDLPNEQMFMPLSFAAMLGGTCTLIGTSTNLVVAGKAKESLGYNLDLFGLGTVGVPSLVVGIIYMIIFSKWLLPFGGTEYDPQNKAREKRKKAEALLTDLKQKDKGRTNDFIVSCIVNPTSPAVNKSVQGANLRHLTDLYLTSVQRNNQLLHAVEPEFVINEYDILQFTGVVEDFPEFCKAHDFTVVTDDNEDTLLKCLNRTYSPPTSPKLTPLAKDESKNSFPEMSGKAILEQVGLQQRKDTFEANTVRAKVKPSGKLSGKTPKEVNFRKTYQAAILSIYREGHKVDLAGNLGRFILGSNDELLLLVNKNFSFEASPTKDDLEQILTNNKNAQSYNTQIEKLDKEYLISMRVSDNSGLLGTKSLVGQTIAEAGLRGLPGMFLIALERQKSLSAASKLESQKSEPEKEVIHAVGSGEVLQKDDLLWFVGDRASLGMLRRIPGLISSNSDQLSKLEFKTIERRLVECVISLSSDMIGKTIKEAKFRTRYRAAVIAVHRANHRILKKVGDIELKAGDVLILDTGPNFISQFRDDKNFLLVAEIENSGAPQFGKFYIALFSVVVMMTIYSTLEQTSELDISLFALGVVTVTIMLLFNIISPERVRSSVSWDVLITIAGAFGLSIGLENTKVAEVIALRLVSLAEATNTGFAGILTAIYLATFLLGIVLANNAAALLMFPIAVQSISKNAKAPVELSDLDEKELEKILFAVMLASSASFASSFGYQTNLMVMGPGNYKFYDFVKFGFPMQFWQMFGSVIFVYYAEQWYICWVVSFIAFGLVVAALFYYEKKANKNEEGSETDKFSEEKLKKQESQTSEEVLSERMRNRKFGKNGRDIEMS